MPKEVLLKDDEVIIKLDRYEELAMLVNTNKIQEAKILELLNEIRNYKRNEINNTR